MDIVVVSKRDNILLGRTEVMFRIVHTNEKTPDRDSVREKLAAILNEKKDTVIIDSMKSQFGKPESHGYAKVYKTKEKALRVERDRTLVRNKLKERKVKAAKAKGAAPPKPEAPKEKAAAPKAEAPKAEAPKEKAAASKADAPKEKVPAPKPEEKPATAKPEKK